MVTKANELAMEYGDLVSVVIPCYNRARSIERAVRGVLLQSYQNLELIVVDDASTDESPTIVEAIEDPRLRLIRHKANKGAATARNTGVAASNGSIIAFQDSDDNWLPNKLEAQMRLFCRLQTSHVAIFCPEIIYGRSIDQKGRKTYANRHASCVPGPQVEVRGGDLSKLFESGNIATLQSMLIRRNAFESAGRFDERLRNNEDWDFNIRLSRIGPIAFDETALVVVYDSFDGISKKRRESMQSYIRILSKLRGSAVEPKTLAIHAMNAAKLLLQHRKPNAARSYVCWAIQLDGHMISRWLLFLATITPQTANAYQWLRKFRT